MTKTYRDKMGGHQLTDVTAGSRGVTCWTQKGRKFIKQLNRRQMRREAARITAEAMRQFALDNEEDIKELMLIDDDYYSEDYDFFESYEDDYPSKDEPYDDIGYYDPYFDDPYYFEPDHAYAAATHY